MKYSVRSDDWRAHIEAFGKLPGATVRYRDAARSPAVRSDVVCRFPFLQRHPDYLDFVVEIEDAVINLDDEPDIDAPDYYCFSFYPLYELSVRTDWLEDGFFRIASSAVRVSPGREEVAEYEFAVATHGENCKIYSHTLGGTHFTNFTIACEGFSNLLRLVVMQQGRFLTEP